MLQPIHYTMYDPHHCILLGDISLENEVKYPPHMASKEMPIEDSSQRTNLITLNRDRNKNYM